MMNSSTATATIPHFIAFDSIHKSAATVVFVFALISTLVLSAVLIGIIWVVSSVAFKRAASENFAREAFFFRSQLGQYACSLLLSKCISCWSGLITIKWVNEGGITTGPSCSTQGVLYEVGEFGSAFFVVLMGLHTFNTLVLRNRQPQWVGPAVTTVGWTAALAFGTGPLLVSDRAGGPLYNIGNLSCGFSRSSPVTHMVLFFVPMFVGSLLSAIIYSLVFLVLRGTITINGSLSFQLDPERRLRLRSATFEEYQRFIYSVARTMLWLPTTFILVLFPSAVVQLMDLSGMVVGTILIAFSYILIYLDGIFDVLILFTVLRVLGYALKSPNSTLSPDPEKGQSKQGPVSRPTNSWDPKSTFAPPSQARIMRTAPPAHPPSTILRRSFPLPLFLRRSSFQLRRKSSNASPSIRSLTSESLSRKPSSSPSLNGSKISAATTIVKKPSLPASVLNAELPLPQPIQKHQESGMLPLLAADSLKNGPMPYSSPRHSRISNTTFGSPSTPRSATPFPEATSSPPAVNRTPTTGDISSLVNLYFSRKSTESSVPPPLPAPAVPHDSPVALPPTSHVSPGRSVSAVSYVGAQAVKCHEGDISPPVSAISLGAVGGGYGRHQLSFSTVSSDLPPAHVVTPVNSTDQSNYSGTEVGSPPPALQESQPPPPLLPVLQPTQPLRFSRVPMTSSPLHTSMDRPVLRVLPLPLTVAAGRRTPSVYSQGSSTVWTPYRQGSSSYRSGYR